MSGNVDARFYVTCDECYIEDESFGPGEFDPECRISLREAYLDDMERKAIEDGWYMSFNDLICPDCWAYGVALDIVDRENTFRWEDWVEHHQQVMSEQEAEDIIRKHRGQT